MRRMRGEEGMEFGGARGRESELGEGVEQLTHEISQLHTRVQ